jgi:hypothetical protein
MRREWVLSEQSHKMIKYRNESKPCQCNDDSVSSLDSDWTSCVVIYTTAQQEDEYHQRGFRIALADGVCGLAAADYSSLIKVLRLPQ